jgi:AraC-like DNA-binding protein
MSFPEGAGRVVCLFTAEDEAALEEEAYATAQAVKYEIERNNPCLVSVAIGASVRKISDLPKSIRGAKGVLRHMEMGGRSLILGEKDIERDGATEEQGKFSIPGPKSSKYVDIIEKSKKFIREHYAESSISLNTVAEFVGLSPNHFSTVFSQETGETFIEHLTNARLQRAKELLRTTARSSEIAYQVGYNDPHYFSYVFKKNVGIAPSEFRKS